MMMHSLIEIHYGLIHATIFFIAKTVEFLTQDNGLSVLSTSVYEYEQL